MSKNGYNQSWKFGISLLKKSLKYLKYYKKNAFSQLETLIQGYCIFKKKI